MSNKILVITDDFGNLEEHTDSVIKYYFDKVNTTLTPKLPLVYCFVSKGFLLFRFETSDRYDLRIRIYTDSKTKYEDFVTRTGRLRTEINPHRFITITKLPRNYRKSL